MDKVNFLGFVVSSQGVEVDEKKVSVTPVLYYRYICIHITFAFTYMLIEFKNKLVFVVKCIGLTVIYTRSQSENF